MCSSFTAQLFSGRDLTYGCSHVCVCFFGGGGDLWDFFFLTHSLFTNLRAGLKMLHVVFEVDKVHINDKTSQSSERGVGKKRTDNRVILRARHSSSASRVSNVRVQKHTETHISLYCTSMVRGVICKLMQR